MSSTTMPHMHLLKSFTRLQQTHTQEEDGEGVIVEEKVTSTLLPKLTFGPQMNSNNKKRERDITIAVFSGGESNTLPWFRNAMAEFIRDHPSMNISVEYVTNKIVRENKCNRFTSPADVIRWCKANTAYFFVSQGIWLGMVTSGARHCGWTVNGIAEALQDLVQSPTTGYPSGLNLKCPVWNGDKMRYFALIPEYVIPTLELDLRIETLSNYSNMHQKIHR